MADFKRLVRADTEDAFDEIWEEFLEEWDNHPAWIKYVSSEWLPKKKQWSQVWRKVCNFQFFCLCFLVVSYYNSVLGHQAIQYRHQQLY